MNSLTKKLIAVFATLAVIVSGWYFFYWMKTPTYSLHLIRDSVKQHDLRTFMHHVDTTHLYGAAYDDMISIALEDTGDYNPFVAAIISGIKPMAVSMLEEETHKYVLSGSKRKHASESASQNVPTFSNTEIVDDMKSRTGFDKLKFTGFGSTEIKDNTAIVELNFDDIELNTKFVLKVAMYELHDGLWRLYEIVNLKEFIKKREDIKTAQTLNQF